MIAGMLLVLGALVALAWTALAVRLVRLTRGPWFRFLPAAGADVARSGGPAVAAIVPARNEEAHVAATVAALRQQDYPNLTLTLIDDESTDGTLAVLRGLQADPAPGLPPLEVVEGTARPDGWVGKTWAVHQAASVATADWLWFVDADMGLDPAALTTALAEAGRTGADFVSFLPGVRCVTFWQRTIAASFLHILAHLYPLDRVNNPDHRAALAAGGFVLVRRAVYERAGGHAAVRHQIVEDIELARNVKRAGGRLAVRLAPSLAWTHMYGSFGAIWVGLRKNAYAGMDYLPHKYVVGAIVALMMAWTPLLVLVGGWIVGSVPLGVIGILGVFAQVAATIPNLIFVGASPAYALALPVGITAYVAIATASVWHYHRGLVHWKGRSISVASLTDLDARNHHDLQSDKIRGQVAAKRR